MKGAGGRWRASGGEPVASDDFATVSTPTRRMVALDAATPDELRDLLRGPPELDAYLASLDAELAEGAEPTADVARAIRAEAVEALAMAKAFADPAWGPRGTQFARRMLRLGRLMEALRIHAAHAENVRAGKRTREGARRGQAARRGAIEPATAALLEHMRDHMAKAGKRSKSAAARAAVRAGLASSVDAAVRAFNRHRHVDL